VLVTDDNDVPFEEFYKRDQYALQIKENTTSLELKNILKVCASTEKKFHASFINILSCIFVCFAS
jgi:hypothetical protein